MWLEVGVLMGVGCEPAETEKEVPLSQEVLKPRFSGVWGEEASMDVLGVTAAGEEGWC